MRTFFFIITLFYSYLSALGQTPDYFANDPKWVCGLWNSNQWNPPFVPSTSTYVYYLNGDSTINGTVFHRLFSRGETVYSGPTPSDFFDSFTGYYLRQENRNIYSYMGSTEQLLVSYDYTVGDTVRGSIFQACGLEQSTIQKIDSVLINTSYRKVFYLDSLFGPVITEGIGHQLQINSTSGEFIFPLCQGVGFDYSITCFGLGNTAYWDSQGLGGNCFLNVGVKENNIANVQIYPNPFADCLFIKSKNAKELNVVIYDFWGRKMLEKNFTKEFQLSTSLFDAGVYFIVINGQAQKFIKR